jgi:hypothetical protein
MIYICRERERERDAYRVLVWKPQGKGPFGGPRRRWEELKWICKKWGGEVNQIDLVRDRSRLQSLVNAEMNLCFHEMQGIC